MKYKIKEGVLHVPDWDFVSLLHSVRPPQGASEGGAS